MTSQLVQRLSNVGVLQTSLEFSEDVGGLGSAYMDGTTNMVVTSDLNDFAVGTGDFTIEWYQYITVQTSYPRVFSIGSYNIGATLAVSIQNEGQYLYFWANGSTILASYVGIPAGEWRHIAIVRYYGVTTAYVDGTAVGNVNTGYSVPTNALNLQIGNENPPDQQYFNGYITNFQWVTGTALYTAPFTPPPIPLSPAPNSKLLLLCGTPQTLTADSSGTGKTVVNQGTVWSDNTAAPAFAPGVSNTAIKSNTFDEVSLAPTILSTNLHAWFDAGNRTSYPGTGVIWYDISGNGFNGIFTLIGPPGSPEPQGLFFNGFSSKIDLSVTNPTLPISLSFWVKPNNAFQMWGIYDSAPGQPHVLRQTHQADPNNTAEWWDGDPYVSTGLVPGTWQYLTVNYHATTGFRSVDTFVNGIPVASGTGSPYIYYAWTSMVLGCINNSTNWYSGYMGQVQIYNRLMTQEEITWNYSVDAARYGLAPSVNVYRNLPPGPTMPQPVAQRQVDDGTLQVKTEFDEVTPI